MAAPHRVLALALVPCLGFACNLLLGHEPGYWIGGDAGVWRLRGQRLTRQRIPAEDRRGDATIEADRTPPRREDGQPTNGARHGRGHHRHPQLFGGG